MPRYHSMVSSGRVDPGDDLVAVTPNDSTDLPDGACRAIRCGATTGAVVGITIAGSTRTLAFFNSGEIIPVGFTRILSTGTVADVEAIY